MTNTFNYYVTYTEHTHQQGISGTLIIQHKY